MLDIDADDRTSHEVLPGYCSGRADEHWFAATMMLEFAMRNGDVLRLKDENFVTRSPECIKSDGDSSVCGNAAKHYLSYTPHKTALSSGRRVYWPIHDDICIHIWGRDKDDHAILRRSGPAEHRCDANHRSLVSAVAVMTAEMRFSQCLQGFGEH